ncbi:MAG: B12-binding domain-containing radical SAM protein, partial [Candidatus Heimdallarchaeaceae archaeon]
MLIKEQNAIKKEWYSEKIKIGLVYPNTYRVAMTSLGVQLLYFLFNSWGDFICERIFKPLDSRTPPYSLENQKKLTDFDVLAISCQFEHDYLETINLLQRGGIHPDARLRKETDPLVIIGGPSPTANPFPILFLPDAFFLGDIEPIADNLRQALESNAKQNKIENLIDIAGMMVLGVQYNSKGEWIGNTIESVKIKNLSDYFYPIKQIIPENVKGTRNEPIFGKAYYLETDRGCSERCLFCFIGHCKFPRAARDLDSLIRIIDQAEEVNDFEKVVIYGSAVAQSGVLDTLINHISSKGYEVSCSSFRADYLTEDLLSALQKGKQRTLAIAPETGHEALRFTLNKKMSDDEIFSSIKLAWEKGFRQIKLYMIYGFPCEKEETKEENSRFIQKIREEYFPTGKISISMNQFITKANTPFQYSGMIEINKSKEEQKWYRKKIYQLKNTELSLYDPNWSIVQRILSIRDQEYFPIIQEIGLIGNTIGNWKKILKSEGKIFAEEATWNYLPQDNLPW